MAEEIESKRKRRRRKKQVAAFADTGSTVASTGAAAGPRPPMGEIATVKKDLDVFVGYIHRMENPDIVLRTEAQGKGLKLYDEVERDTHSAGVINTRALAVVGKEWEIVPATSPKRIGRNPTVTMEQKIAEFVSRILQDVNFDAARAEILKGILYGFYISEILWKNRSGDIVIDKLVCKHPRRFVFDYERNLRLLTWDSMIEGEPLPDRKFIVFTYGDSDNPYGRGLGQKLWWPVWFKKNVIRFWLVFLEKFGMPTVVGKYPPGTGPEAKQALFDAIDAIQNETGITIPDGTTLEFLEATRAGRVEYEACCEYMDKQITKAVLGQTGTTEGTPGKLGNEDAQDAVRADIVEADADLLDSCLNSSLIKWIVDYNFPGVTDYPKIKTYAEPKPDLQARSAIDKTLIVDIGLPVTTAYLYDAYGIPIPQEGEELVNVPKPEPSPLPGAPGSSRKGEKDKDKGKDKDDDDEGKKGKFAEAAPEDLGDWITDIVSAKAMKATDRIYMAPLKKLVDEAESLQDIRDGIIHLYSEMSPAEVGVLIAHGMALAELSGRYEVAGEQAAKLGLKKKGNSMRA